MQEAGKIAIQIIGKYPDVTKAVKVASGLELKGFKARHILIITNHSSEALKKLTDVEVVSNIPPEENEVTLFEKFKQQFLKHSDDTLDLKEKLLRFGVLEELATKYIADVEAGKTVVIADDELKMGHVYGDSPPAL